MLKQIIGLITIILLLACSYTSAKTTELKPVRLGSVAMDTPAAMHARLRPLTVYLSQVLKRPVILQLSPNMPAAINDVANGRVDLAYLTPVAYIRSHDKGATQLVAKLITKQKASFQLMIVVREDSPIKTIDDLVGKRFAFGDKAALLQRAAVVGAKVSLDSFSHYGFLGHYDNIVRAVLHGEYDAGIVKDTKAYKWSGKGIRILYSSPDLPPYNVAAKGKMDSELLDQLKQAFLNLDANNPKHVEIIKALDKKYNGFAPTNDAEYDVVRKLIKPFNKTD